MNSKRPLCYVNWSTAQSDLCTYLISHGWEAAESDKLCNSHRNKEIHRHKVSVVFTVSVGIIQLMVITDNIHNNTIIINNIIE